MLMSASSTDWFGFTTDDTFWVRLNDGSGLYQSSAVYRDVSAWYHVVVAVDTTQATASNRMKLYINGVQITSFGTNTQIPQNTNTTFNSTVGHGLGYLYGVGYYANFYSTEVVFIDGQALTPSSFGETNAQTGVWQPKAYSGSYGTNGFYLNFSDNSNTTAATLGKDYSGNGNNWTPNNFSVTAGAGNDSLVDSPTSYGTDTGVGGTVRGNYCTLNPLTFLNATFANGNLDAVVAAPETSNAVGTFGVSSGKWYWEVTPTTTDAGMIGVCDISASATNRSWQSANGWSYFKNGNKYNNNSGTAYGASWVANDVIGVALDMDAGTLVFYKNGTSQGTAYSTGLSGKTITAYLGNGNGSGGASQYYSCNFGQRPFAYTAPSGFKALCTQNLPTPTIGATTATQAGKYFNPVLYTGTSAVQTISGVGFQPDFTWLKVRNAADNHYLFDAVRGKGATYMKTLYSNATNAESPGNSTSLDVGVTDFASDGFTFGSGTLNGNQSPYTFVAWNWKANGSGSTNTSGSITSTVSANTTSGFSVVTYTGAGGTATVGHGLGVAPSVVIVKRRDSTSNWIVYHAVLGATKGLILQTTAAETTSTNFWNNTAPTSTVFTIGSDSTINTATYVAYCFSEVAGFSKFGSYVGNGSADGPFVFCGFRPAYVMIKASSGTSTGNWVIQDDTRNPFNVSNNNLYANLSNAEDTSFSIDFLSNGFKLRSSAYDATNQSGASYVFMAFAEVPTKFSLAR
jgi:hypothetical protein